MEGVSGQSSSEAGKGTPAPPPVVRTETGLLFRVSDEWTASAIMTGSTEPIPSRIP